MNTPTTMKTNTPTAMNSNSSNETPLQSAATQNPPRGREAWSWEEVCTRFCPDNWPKAAGNPLFCAAGNIPRLGQLDKLFGPGHALEWMLGQLRQLFKSAGYSRDAERARDLCDFAADFIVDTAQLKLSELMLFFSGYRCGRYGDSFAAPSPRILGICYRRDFLPYLRKLRLKVIEQHHLREDQKRRQRPESHPVTYEEYLRCTEITLRATVLRPEGIRRLQAAAIAPLEGYDPSLPLPQYVAARVPRVSPLTDAIYHREPGEPRLFEWN